MPDSQTLQSFLRTVLAIIPLFGLMAVGLLGRKLKMLCHDDAGVLARFAVLIAMPALVLSSLIVKPYSTSEIALPSLYWIVQFVALACAIGAAKLMKFDRAGIGGAIFTTFGNTGFIGYPMAAALFPNQLPEAILMDQLGMSIILYGSYGIVGSLYGSGSDKGLDIKHEIGHLLKTPVFIAVAIGLVIHFWETTQSGHQVIQSTPVSPILACVALLGAATIPVIMTSVGIRLSAGHAKKYLGQILVFGVIKMVIMPLVGWELGRTFYHLSGDMLGECVLCLAMPPAAAATAFSAELKTRPEMVVANFFVCTLASALTIPLLVGLLR